MSGRADEFDEADALRLAAWAEATVAPVAPPPALRARILGDLSGIARFQPVAEALRRFVDLGVDAVDGLLRKIDDAAAWAEGFPRIRYFHFAPGPAAAGAEAGFVRIGPGATFPNHRHLGPERTFVLDGIMHDRGRVYGPGSVIESDTGTVHDYTAGPGRDLIIISLHKGFELV